ncbi:MAG: RNA methyltransferase [Chloroflexi bacterium]|nr:RNA methyltransferase [Chloroflexota bacterium]
MPNALSHLPPLSGGRCRRQRGAPVSDEGPVQRLTRARLRQLQKLRTARERRAQRLFLIDGEKLVRDALDACAPIVEILSTTPELWQNADLPLTALSQADAERLSDTRTPQGHFALIRDQLGELQIRSSDRWQVVALDAIQDAGNVGGIIRSAAAFGVDSVLVGPGSADPTHPRVTRAATGAWFNVRISRSVDLLTDVTELRQQGAAVWAADQRGAPLREQKLPSKIVWIFGNEGAGVAKQFDDLIDARIAVPIGEGVESLNVNVAAGIILHHAYERVHERSAT